MTLPTPSGQSAAIALPTCKPTPRSAAGKACRAVDPGRRELTKVVLEQSAGLPRTAGRATGTDTGRPKGVFGLDGGQRCLTEQRALRVCGGRRGLDDAVPGLLPSPSDLLVSEALSRRRQSGVSA